MMATAWQLASSTSWIAQAATGGIIAAVWQGILLSGVVALGFRMVPKIPAAVRFAIWFGVFLVVAALPLAAMLHRGDSAAATGQGAWLTLDVRWCLIIMVAWGVASLVRAATLLLAVLRVRALWKRARPLEFAPAIVHHAGSRRAELCVSDEVDRPAVIGFFAPKILIPTSLVEKLTPAELQQIVLHEEGHLDRADDWMNLLQKIALVVFPLNPALSWVERRLCFEREFACDERVLATTGAPKAYAACLAALAEHRLGRRGLTLALGALGRESELGRRVRRILWRGDRMRPLQASLVLGGALLGLLTAAVGLERCPQIVGFAPTADVANVANDPVRISDNSQSSYGYQPVVFHAPAFGSQVAATSGLRMPPDASGKAKLARRTIKRAVARPSLDSVLRASVATPAEDRDATIATGGVRNEDVSYSEVAEPNLAAARRDRDVVQWVVVTSWRGRDGSRVLLTTFHSEGSAANAVEVPGASSAVESQVHQFAAVPMQDGWLVIQL